MIRYLIVHILVGTLLSVAIGIVAGQNKMLSFALGASLQWLNVLILSIVWAQILKKKLIALYGLIIVFKYAILGVIIYRIFQLPWISIGYFVAGLSTLVVAVLSFAIFRKEERDVIQPNITDSWSG